EGKPVGTPDAGAFFRAIEEHGVNVHFTAPTAMRVVRKEDPDGKLMKKYDLSSLRAEFLAGERLDPDTFEWTKQTLAEATGRDIPVVDNWWQTETGWLIAANPLGLTQFPPQARLPHQTGARLSGGDPRPERHARARRGGGPHRHAAAVAAGNHGDG